MTATADNSANNTRTTAPHPAPPATPLKFFTSTEIAARFGVTLAAVSNWRRRYGPDSTTPFPAPEDGHPTDVWRQDRWPEIEAWNEQRGGHRRGRRRGTRQPTERQYLSVKDIAERLNVTPRTVRQWRSKTWSMPFPQPDKEIVQKSRTVARWRAERLPDIQRWREWHLTHLATRSQRQDNQDHASHEITKIPKAPPPSQFLKSGRSTSRTRLRQGRVAHPGVRRGLR